jgi:hypothetical protein
MASDLTITLENRPGKLADLGEALAAAGVNVDGMCGVTAGSSGEIHILVEDAGAARAALEGAGIPVDGVREVLVLSVEDRPGTLGSVTRRIADAGVNIDLVYLAAGTRLVIGADNPAKAAAAIS